MRMFIVVVGLGVVLLACGGAQESVPESREPASDSPSADETGSAAGGPVNVATVTIGDRTLEFDVTPGGIQRCDPEFFGAFWVLGGGLDMLLVAEDHPDHDPPSIKIDDPDDPDVEWWAAAEINDSLGAEVVPEGASQVDAISIDGNTATGTATFIERSAINTIDPPTVPEPVAGSFEVTCED